MPQSYIESALTVLTCTGASCESRGLLPGFYLGGALSMPGNCMWTCGGKATLGKVFIDVLPSSSDCNFPPVLHKHV